MASTDEQQAEVAAPKRIRRKAVVRPDGEPSAPASSPRKRATRKRVQPQQPDLTEPDESALDLVVTEALGLPEAAEPLDFATQVEEPEPDVPPQGAEPDRQQQDTDAAGEESERPVTSFGVLFQAPEPPVTRPRNRRLSEPSETEAGPEDIGPDGIPGAPERAPETGAPLTRRPNRPARRRPPGVGDVAGAARGARAGRASRSPAPTRTPRAARMSERPRTRGRGPTPPPLDGGPAAGGAAARRSRVRTHRVS